MATTYNPYTGTYDTEYEAALGQAQKERTAADNYLTGIRSTEEQGLAQQRDYSKEQLGQSLASAQKDAYGTYMGQQRLLPNQLRALGITGGGSETANAKLNTAYQNTRGAAQTSYDKSLADVLQQWNVNMNDIAARYGQMGYGNLKDMYSNANSNAWNRYNTGLTRDSDMWGRSNTETQQELAQTNLEEERRIAQANADREYQFALDQWNFNKEQALKAAAGSSGGSSGSGGSTASSTTPSTTTYRVPTTSYSNGSVVKNPTIDTSKVNNMGEYKKKMDIGGVTYWV